MLVRAEPTNPTAYQPRLPSSIARAHSFSAAARSCIGTAEQIAERLPLEQRAPASPLMLRPVVDHVAPLAEGREVDVGVVRGVVIPMGCGQHHPGRAHEDEHIHRPSLQSDPPAPPVSPPAGVGVPPAAIAEVVDYLRPCGRPQPSQRPLARPKRITAESCGQSIG